MKYIIKRWFKYLAYADHDMGYYLPRRKVTLRNGEFCVMTYENIETAKSVAKRFKGRVVNIER